MTACVVVVVDREVFGAMVVVVVVVVAVLCRAVSCCVVLCWAGLGCAAPGGLSQVLGLGLCCAVL